MARGYIKIENEYFRTLAALDLKGSEFKVLLFLLRNSICFKRDFTKECSASYIAQATKLSDRQVKRALNVLSDKKLIYLDLEHSSKKGHSWYIASDKLGFMRGQTWSISGDTYVTDKVPSMSHKENKENKSIEIKEKERASLHFFPCETSLMQDMDDAEKIKYIEMLPEEMRNRNPDDYTDNEWDIYDKWRCENGLI